MVNSFEAVGTSLVKEENFMDFMFTQDQLTIEANIVSTNKCKILYYVCSTKIHSIGTFALYQRDSSLI